LRQHEVDILHGDFNQAIYKRKHAVAPNTEVFFGEAVSIGIKEADEAQKIIFGRAFWGVGCGLRRLSSFLPALDYTRSWVFPILSCGSGLEAERPIGTLPLVYSPPPH
jgi:hypothetical protein